MRPNYRFFNQNSFEEIQVWGQITELFILNSIPNPSHYIRHTKMQVIQLFIYFTLS